MSLYFTCSVILILVVIIKDIFKLYLRNAWALIGWILAHALHQSNSQSDAGLMARVVVLEDRLKRQETEINKVLSQSWSIRKHARENIATIKKELETVMMRTKGEEHIYNKQGPVCLNDGDCTTTPLRRVATFEVLGSPLGSPVASP